jgi:hypothetical protein
VRHQLRDEVEHVVVRILEERVHAEHVQRLAGDARRIKRLVAIALGVFDAQVDALHGIGQTRVPVARFEHHAEAARPHLAQEVVVARARDAARDRGVGIVGHAVIRWRASS